MASTLKKYKSISLYGIGDDDEEAEEEWGKLGNKACEVESLLSIGQGMG